MLAPSRAPPAQRYSIGPVTVTIERPANSPGVVAITIANPPVNATSIVDLTSLAEHLSSLTSEDHVVLILAHGRGFSAGGDLKEMESLPGHEGIIGQCVESAKACVAISQCPVPVVIAVHDYCLGVGLELVGSADISVAADDAVFQWTEIDNGTVGGAAQGYRMLPPQTLRYLMFTAEPISATELHRLGGLTEVVSPDRLSERAMEIASMIAAKPAGLLRQLKKSLDGLETFDVETAMRYEQGFIFQMNMEGDGSAARQRFLDGKREGLSR
ncbi:MAG: enoyl-CoA hydratase [Acidimicrobiales bacterium]|jgi:enoyl-CoA hydratase